ncbi:hypothetical protein ACQ4PT_021214 [Festuca glaucescens]
MEDGDRTGWPSSSRWRRCCPVEGGGGLLCPTSTPSAATSWNRILEVAQMLNHQRRHGQPNRPDVDLFNHYLCADVMSGALPHEMLDLVDQMREFKITPNTASFNLVVKSMAKAREVDGGERLVDR